MSYILDALRKAERERTRGDTPPAAWPTAPAPVEQLVRYRPLLLGLLCLLLAAAVLITSARDRRDAAARAAAPASATTLAAPPAAAAANDVADDTAMTLQQQNPATLDEVVAGTEDSATADEAAALSAMVVHRDPEPAAAPISQTSGSVASSDAAESAQAAPPSPPATTEVERVQLQAAPPPQAPKLKDMPADYRTAFPDISLDVHVYDANAAKRFVMMGGHRYNEGDAPQAGLRIVQIVPDGVVFEFRGEQTLFTIAH